MSTYYHPELTLTEVDSAKNTWKLTTKIFYPAGETGREVANVVVLSNREITVDVIDNPSFKSDHYVTSTKTFTRQTGEKEITVEVKKDGKKKGKAVIVYSKDKANAA